MIRTWLAGRGKPDPDARRRFFAARRGNRYWWHRKTGDRYLPDLYAMLDDDEWTVLRTWFEDTDQKNLVGECSVPLMSWLTSFVSSNDVSRVVQLGTYVGYSSLLLGWSLRRMGKRNAMLAVDIDPTASTYAGDWLGRAGLNAQVRLHLGDSADPTLPARAAELLGGPPQLLFIDSSHQYEHTLRELELWVPSLPVGSVIALHDTSEFAASFDSSGAGGVRRALDEWTARHAAPTFNLALPTPDLDAQRHVYLDGCGLGLILKSG